MIPNFIKEKFNILKERISLSKLWKYLNLPDIILLQGMRQTGKTSLLFLLIKRLLEKGIPETNIFYFSLDDPLILSSFNKDAKELDSFIKKQTTDPQQKIYIFIDEIQYLQEPTTFLKYYYDNVPAYKFIVTGSSSFAIKQKFKDSLAGRKAVFNIAPLTFAEFLHFKGIDYKIDFGLSNVEQLAGLKLEGLTKETLIKSFEDYLLYGGHPRICLLESEDLKIDALKEIYNSYIRKDIKDLSNIQNIDGFNGLIQVLASQVGNMVNIQELANTLNINHITLKNYLFLLENTFVINLLKPYFKNKRKEISKMPKVYVEDLGIRNVSLADFRKLELRAELGSLIENFVLNEFYKYRQGVDEIYFWRTIGQQEVDFVYKSKDSIIPVEVKYSPFKEQYITSGMRNFIQNYKPQVAVTVTKDYLSETKFQNTSVYFIPAWLI